MSSEKARPQASPTVILRKKRPPAPATQPETKPSLTAQSIPRPAASSPFTTTRQFKDMAAPPTVVPRKAPPRGAPPREAPPRGASSFSPRKRPAPKRHAAPPPPPPPRDPSLPNRKQRDAEAQREMLAEFRARWPRAFPQTIQAIKPLARGIHQEIAAAFPDVKQWRIKQAIARFQRGYDGAYWRAVVKGGSRYALDGSPSGEVTAKEQEQAKATLAAIEAQRAASAQARSTGEPPQADADSAEAS